MKIKPIPKNLLIHTVTHKTNPSDGTWGDVTFGNSQVLSHVRVEPTSKIVLTKDNKEIKLSAVMLYDITNSTPSATFAEKDGITFDGRDYTVFSVEPLYDNKKLHHYEVGLI